MSFIRWLSRAAIVFGALACTTALGAESVASLIDSGRGVISGMEQLQTRHAQLQQQADQLNVTAKEVETQEKELSAKVTSHNQASTQLTQNIATYKKTCQSRSLDMAQLDRCQALQRKLNSEINSVNADTKTLTTEQTALQQKASSYNSESSTWSKAEAANTGALNKAFYSEEEWLDKARDMVASGAFAPYRKSARCPDVVQPPATPEGMHAMAKSVLACLERVAAKH